jgi:DNA excision repair protein ERCC-2
VIRTGSDCGVVVLIDDRFTRPGVRSLLPGWWQVSQRRAKPSPSDPADAPSGTQILY